MKGRRVADEDRVVGLHHADGAETTVPVDAPVDSEALRAEVRKKYRQVASDPDGLYHFHTGRRLAEPCRNRNADQTVSMLICLTGRMP